MEAYFSQFLTSDALHIEDVLRVLPDQVAVVQKALLSILALPVDEELGEHDDSEGWDPVEQRLRIWVHPHTVALELAAKLGLDGAKAAAKGCPWMKVDWSRVELERDFIVALAQLRATPDPQALQRLWARLSPESQNAYRVQRAQLLLEWPLLAHFQAGAGGSSFWPRTRTQGWLGLLEQGIFELPPEAVKPWWCDVAEVQMDELLTLRLNAARRDGATLLQRFELLPVEQLTTKRLSAYQREGLPGSQVVYSLRESGMSVVSLATLLMQSGWHEDEVFKALRENGRGSDAVLAPLRAAGWSLERLRTNLLAQGKLDAEVREHLARLD